MKNEKSKTQKKTEIVSKIGKKEKEEEATRRKDSLKNKTNLKGKVFSTLSFLIKSLVYRASFNHSNAY